MNRKYLDDIGVLDRYDNNWDHKHRSKDKRRHFWKKQRKIYGFDERETWSLDGTFLEWLYERLRMYLDVNCVDLTYHKFEYNGKEYTQEALIKLMISDLETYFNMENNEEVYLEMPEYKNNIIAFEDKKISLTDEVTKIWSIVYNAMWW